MQVSSRPSNGEGHENLVHRLVAQLSRHVLWDCLLIFVPPAAALTYLVAVLFRFAWLSPMAAILTGMIILALVAPAILLRRRPLIPTIPATAHLVDERSGAKDHFLTLATIDPANQSVAFLLRVRQQAAGFLARVELKRDFPYRFKRSAYWSLGLSLAAAILIHALMPVAYSARYSTNVHERLREIAQEMAAKSSLRPLAKELEALLTKLDDPKISPEEKQALAHDLEQKVEEQSKKEEEKDNRDLLGDASSALSGVEKQQQAASGQEQQKQQQKDGGGLQSNAPQEGQGENKQSQGGSAESKGESSAQLSQEQMDQGKSAQPNSMEQVQDKNQDGDAKNNQNQPDPNQPGKDAKEKAGKTEGGSKDGAGKQQASAEPPPQGGPQADRFYKPGEGKEGLGSKGYVTVQLPEDVIADAKGESRPTKESKNGRTRTQIPVSNVPLPAHVPNAPAEKQQVPIEYRGILR
jgi:hypothetical protein